jgi:hypothetical protein
MTLSPINASAPPIHAAGGISTAPVNVTINPAMATRIAIQKISRARCSRNPYGCIDDPEVILYLGRYLLNQ